MGQLDITSQSSHYFHCLIQASQADRQIDNKELEVGLIYLLLTIYVQSLKRRYDTTKCTTLFKSLSCVLRAEVGEELRYR